MMWKEKAGRFSFGLSAQPWAGPALHRRKKATPSDSQLEGRGRLSPPTCTSFEGDFNNESSDKRYKYTQRPVKVLRRGSNSFTAVSLAPLLKESKNSADVSSMNK